LGELSRYPQLVAKFPPRGKDKTDWGGVDGLLTQYIGEERNRKMGIPVEVRPLGV